MKRAFLFIFISIISLSVKADIKLPSLVGNQMVLQRDKPINIWGSANPKERITISFANRKYTTLADSKGNWKVKLASMKAGGPYTMTLQGKNTITLKDILIGDVWICSGQSNMEFPLSMSQGAEEEIARANYPSIRLFTVDKKISLQPLNDVKGYWSICNSNTIKNFSAIGYYFGRDLTKKLNIPIGLIHSSWGGTVIESWISAEGLKGEPTFGAKTQTVSKFDTVYYNQKQRHLHKQWVENFNKQDEGFRDNRFIWANNEETTNEWKDIDLPIIWEFKGLAIDGVVWFKKEIDLVQNDLNTPTELNLGVIQNADITFINGVEIGRTPDKWGVARRYKIPTGLLKEGKNVITVRVENYGGDGGFSSKPAELVLNTGTKSIPLSGLWKYKIGYQVTKNDRPEKEIGPNTLPTLMYNNMISPLINLSIKGVIWYQGESNWFRGYQYRELFTRMIQDWRRKFAQGDFPFLFVQLASHHQKLTLPADSYWAEVREAQDLTQRVVNTGMVTAIDIGDAGNIHPINKEEVGRRLALVAKKNVYQLPVFAYGPKYESYEIVDEAIFIHYNNTVNGLKTRDDQSPGNFQVAGSDKKFYWAKAEIVDENTIKVSADEVSKPVAVRYAWEDNPVEANVVNSVNLPAYPFRTDSWRGISADNR